MLFISRETNEEDDSGLNEKYCLCQNVSYGSMIACDNDDCEHGEWFHFNCVGLTNKPKGKWYCPNCKEIPSFQAKIKI